MDVGTSERGGNVVPLMTDTMREAALQDVAHEVVALEVSWNRHTGNRLAWTAWFVHARNLLAFFDRVNDNRDDLRAFHFFDPPANWAAHRQHCSVPSDRDATEEAANKLAAHLTLDRAAYRRAGGFAPSEGVTDYLRCLTTVFERGLPPDHSKRFAVLLAEFRNELAA